MEERLSQTLECRKNDPEEYMDVSENKTLPPPVVTS